MTPWTVATSLLSPWDFPGKNTWVGCHFLLQGIFPTPGLSPCLLHWQADCLPLSHQGSLFCRPTIKISTCAKLWLFSVLLNKNLNGLFLCWLCNFDFFLKCYGDFFYMLSLQYIFKSILMIVLILQCSSLNIVSYFSLFWDMLVSEKLTFQRD